MPDAPMDNRMLLKRTLVAMGALVGACVVVVSALTLLASLVVGHALAPSSGESVAEPAPSARPTRSPAPGVRPLQAGTPQKTK